METPANLGFVEVSEMYYYHFFFFAKKLIDTLTELIILSKFRKQRTLTDLMFWPPMKLLGKRNLLVETSSCSPLLSLYFTLLKNNWTAKTLPDLQDHCDPSGAAVEAGDIDRAPDVNKRFREF